MDIEAGDDANVNSVIDVEIMEMDAIQPVIIPLSQDEEDDLSPDLGQGQVKPHYRQNNTGLANISPRAAKYRENKLKLPRHITVPQPGGSMRGNSTSGQSSMSHSPTSLHGSMRSYPETKAMPRSSSGTLRSLHSGVHGSIKGISTQDGTLRIYQNNSSNPPAGFQSHHLPLGGTMPNNHNSIAFRRNKVRKEDLITQFAIELDKHERHRYFPGEEISGRIIFDMRSRVDIKFIEFLIEGQTSVSFTRKGAPGYKTWRDVFLCKRSYVVGTPDSKWASTVTPGHYVSKFKFRLPEGIPSSLRYKDDVNGFATEVGYKVKARICDELGASSIRSIHSVHNYVKILMARQCNFTVKRPFDIHSIPLGLTPVSHTEDVTLSSCSIFSTDLTKVKLSLDRSCFLAGDEIKLKIEISNFSKQIKKIRGELLQNVSLYKPKLHLTYTIAGLEQSTIKGLLIQDNHRAYELAIPTQTTILPSINPGCRMFKVTYSLAVVIYFSTCGGQLSLDVPIHIGPCTDPVNLEKRNSVPVFNRPMRFPYFSPHDNVKVSNGHVESPARPPKLGVTSKFSHSNSSVICCWAPETLM